MPEVPVEQTVTSTNTSLSVSGSTQVSGVVETSSAYGGFWYVETQTMNIDYHRVPIGSLSSFDLDLDSVSVTERHNATILIAEVRATYTAKKEFGSYTTSAWQVPQKFEVLGFSADSLGQSYGALTASTLGPVGSIVTSQPWYSRVAWDNTQPLAIKEMEALTYYATDNDGLGTSAINAIPYNDSYEYWWIQQGPGSLNSDSSKRVGTGMPLYSLPGTYSTGQENNFKMIQLLDSLGLRVAGFGYYANPATLNSNQYPIWDQGFAEYDRNRHDYS